MMKRPKGYGEIATIGECPVYIHWSFLFGGVPIAVLVHAEPEYWIYYCFFYFLLILLHEAGHFLAAVMFRLKVFSVEIFGAGGRCWIERPRHIHQCVIVYSAGVVVQTVILMLMYVYFKSSFFTNSAISQALVSVLLFVNAFLLVCSLTPYTDRKGFDSDGKVLWQLWLHVFKGHRHPRPSLVPVSLDQSPVFPPETRLLAKPGFSPIGFVQGVEILNDRTTPMDFVVDVLTSHLKFSSEEALVKMLEIHNTGGMLIGIQSEELARCIADSVSSQAAAAGYSFVCRYSNANDINAI